VRERREPLTSGVQCFFGGVVRHPLARPAAVDDFVAVGITDLPPPDTRLGHQPHLHAELALASQIHLNTLLSSDHSRRSLQGEVRGTTYCLSVATVTRAGCAPPQLFHYCADHVQKISLATAFEAQLDRRLNGATPANHRRMGYENSRRCALWVSARIFVEAEKLAGSIGLDVDTFIEGTVLALLEKQGTNGAPRTRARAEKSSSMGHVISMADWSSRLRRSG